MKKYILLLLVFQALCFPGTVFSQEIKYQYDALGRVVQVEDYVNGNRAYDYDPAGNRKSLTRPVAVAPVISPVGGNYNNFQTITLSTQTQGATIYYTLNGTAPAASSLRYTSPFQLTSGATLRAIAIKPGFINSPESTSSFSFTVSKPIISPGGGTWSNTFSISLTTATTGADIYYTLNGSAPSINSTRYTGPVSFIGSATLRTIAVKSGMTSSAENSASFTFVVDPGVPGNAQMRLINSCVWEATWSAVSGADNYYLMETQGGAYVTGLSATVICPPGNSEARKPISVQACKSGICSAQAVFGQVIPIVTSPAITPASGIYFGSQTVSMTTATSGAKIYYTTNNTVPSTNSTAYTGSFVVSSTTIIRAIASKFGMTNSTESSVNLSLNPPVSSPGFSPAGGSYLGSQTVSLTSATSGATIYYTTNNTAPTTGSSVYTGPLSLTSTTTIRAIAVKSGMTSSAESTATFTISTPPANPTGLQSRKVADCAWNASWNPVSGADRYLVLTNSGVQTVTTPSISYSCPAGSGDTYRPIWVQVCNSVACSSQINF